jgi:hypothetical protein
VCFLFLICCSISEWSPCSIENCDLQMEHSTSPTCWSSYKKGYSASKLSVKTHLLFSVLMILYP